MEEIGGGKEVGPIRSGDTMCTHISQDMCLVTCAPHDGSLLLLVYDKHTHTPHVQTPLAICAMITPPHSKHNI